MQSAINRQENALTQFKLKTGETFRPLIIGGWMPEISCSGSSLI
jgi:hypothetical protein